MKDDRYYLTLMNEYIEKILEYTQEGYDFFLSDEKTQDAVVRKLQILTESTQRLSDEIKTTEPKNSLAGYFRTSKHFGSSIYRDQYTKNLDHY